MSASVADEEPWWKGAVIYQVYPRSFQDSDGDGVGDLAGLLTRLPYIASLGVDGIWLSPVFASPMRDFGYDVSDHRAIDPLFGTLADFDAVVEGAHALGLKLIVDQVWSHTSSDHPWFVESRSPGGSGEKANWYVWAPARADGSPPNNWQSTFGGPAWTWDTGRRRYYLHNFLSSQPDLDLHHPKVQAEILEVAGFWLDRGVDGFRLDVVNCFTHDRDLRDNPPSGEVDATKPYFMQRHLFDRSRPETAAFVARVRTLLDAKPGRFAVAELASEDPLADTRAYASGDAGLHTAYSFRLLGPKFSAARVRDTVTALAQEAPDAWPSFAFSNHDFPRVASRWSGGRPAATWAKTLIALLTSLRGTAFLYQGEELGLAQAHVPRDALRDPDGIAGWPAHVGRDGCRTPMPWRADAPQLGFTTGRPWLPAAPEHAPLAVDRQERADDSVLAFTRRWLAYRGSRPGLRTGALTLRDAGHADVLAFTRQGREGDVTLMFNCSTAALAATLPAGRWREGFPLGGHASGDRVMLPVGAGWCGESDPP